MTTHRVRFGSLGGDHNLAELKVARVLVGLQPQLDDLWSTCEFRYGGPALYQEDRYYISESAIFSRAGWNE